MRTRSPCVAGTERNEGSESCGNAVIRRGRRGGSRAAPTFDLTSIALDRSRPVAQPAARGWLWVVGRNKQVTHVFQLRGFGTLNFWEDRRLNSITTGCGSR